MINSFGLLRGVSHKTVRSSSWGGSWSNFPPSVSVSLRHKRSISDSLSTVSIVKYVPDWFPGTGWKQTAAKYKASTEEMACIPHDMVKQQLMRNRGCGCQEFG